MPENSPFLLGIAVHSNQRGGSMSPRLFLQQNTAKPEFYYLSPNCRIMRSLACLAYLIVFALQSPHRAFLWFTRGYLRQKRRKLEQSLAALISSLNCDYHLATAPINSFVFVGVLDFTTPNLQSKLILQTRQNWKVGCATNLYVVGVAGGREMRRKWFTTPTLSPA